MRTKHLCLIALSIATASTAAAAPDDAPATSRWTANDVLRSESAGSVDLSRDGTLAVWTLQQWVNIKGEDKRIGRLWLTHIGSNESRQLTQGPGSVGSPLLSPDGKRIAFTSSRKPAFGDDDKRGDTQVWIIPVDGGEARLVTRLERSVSQFAWIDDSRLLVLATERPTLFEQEAKKHKDTSVVINDAHHEPSTRLLVVDVKTGEPTRLTTGDQWLRRFAMAPDGAHAVVIAQRSLSYAFDERTPPATMLVDLSTGVMRELFPGTRLAPGRMAWTPDSSGFYFTNQRSSDPVYTSASVTDLHYFDLASQRLETVDLDWERGLARSFAATRTGVVAMLAHGVYDQIARIDRVSDGWRRTDLAGVHAQRIDSFTMARDGVTMIYAHSSATTPSQLYSASLNAASLSTHWQITDLNASFKAKPMGKVEVITWKGANGDTVEGLLHYPLDFNPDNQYPLIVNPHGGPAAASRDSWRQSYGAPLVLWRQRGAFVFQPNYHGSAGYGLAWVESIGGGKYYELEYDDIEKGVDAIIAKGNVDPDKLAVVGWSNGGILAAELITRTHRYKAASIGAADVEWISDWANVDFGAAFDNYYFGSTPWENPQLYIDKSPFFRLENVTTPTIIYTGDKDRNVPPHQSWSLFRALQQIGKAPVRFVTFPGEPHGLRNAAHQRRKLDEDTAWLGRYLFDDYEPANEALKKDSPLAWAMTKAKASRADALFGVRLAGALTPEVVEMDGAQIGRFEVTRAQYAAFDSSAGFDPAQGNMPATNISFAQAKAYVRWLSQVTGATYRLPTIEEARRFAKRAGTAGVTLAMWAGYSPNLDDARRLDEIVASLPADALLKNVGSAAPIKGAGVFDLDGNAAEWAVDNAGAGVAVGPSADRAPDKRGQAPAASRACTGFRVLRDQ